MYIGQPLDTVKVKMQTFPALYTNAFQCFMSTVRQEGIAHGLYAGTVPSLMAQVSENAVLFMAYGVCQKLVASVAGKTSVDSLSVMQNGFAGMLSLSFCPSNKTDCHFHLLLISWHILFLLSFYKSSKLCVYIYRCVCRYTGVTQCFTLYDKAQKFRKKHLKHLDI